MNTPPAHINLKPNNAEPYARLTPIPVPYHWKEWAKQGLDWDVERGIITPVPTGTPTKWCCPMVITSKKNGKPCHTVDLQQLNAQCQQETHHTTSLSTHPVKFHHTQKKHFWCSWRVPCNGPRQKKPAPYNFYQLLSPNGDILCTLDSLKDSLHQGMLTPATLTK